MSLLHHRPLPMILSQFMEPFQIILRHAPLIWTVMKLTVIAALSLILSVAKARVMHVADIQRIIFRLQKDQHGQVANGFSARKFQTVLSQTTLQLAKELWIVLAKKQIAVLL